MPISNAVGDKQIKSNSPFFTWGGSIRVDPFIVDNILCYDIPDNERIPRLDIPEDKFYKFVDENWLREYWAVDIITGKYYFPGVPCNDVSSMKYMRIMEFNQMVHDDLFETEKDLMYVARKLIPDVDQRIINFDKEEYFWQFLKRTNIEWYIRHKRKLDEKPSHFTVTSQEAILGLREELSRQYDLYYAKKEGKEWKDYQTEQELYQ